MKFAGTKRNTYTKSKVKSMRNSRLTLKPKVEGVHPDAYKASLGELAGAGHLKISGHGVTVNRQKLDTQVLKDHNTYGYEIKFTKIASHAGLDESPHFSGYVESAFDADKKPYNVKGWFNPDGTMRIEIVK